MHDLPTPMPAATMLSPTLPTFLALSQPQPPLLSLHTELLELVVLHFATRPPTQPSANLIHPRRPTLGISRRRAETIHGLTLAPPRTAFDRGLAVATLPNGFSYLQLGSTPFSVDICWLVVALVFIQRPASSMHRFPRDARLYMCTPPMLTACIPIATFDVTGRVADHEPYPSAPHIVLGGYDGRVMIPDNATPWRTKQLIV
ncbi:hypothetical protein B0H14DRAFT_3870725 [Mycena olivaceomarginata]|nr:hypothetical protein B0H14DRAFT_3870725 [Mycena olivaceomarginata]